MIAGLPGTGIGGLFYLISALAMPVREAWRAATGNGEPQRQRLALRQSAMALLIMGAIWLTGLVLTLLHIGNVARQTSDTLRVLYIAPALVAFGTLTVVLVAVELLYLSLSIGAKMSQRLSNEASASGGDR
jgi:hypothetical protein